MILSSDELEIVDYLKSWKGTPVSIVEICRQAGGRQKFRECATWANPLMARLVEENLIALNERGHYFFPGERDTQIIVKNDLTHKPAPELMNPPKAEVVGEDYFPEKRSDIQELEDTAIWLSPNVEDILRSTRKLPGE